MNLLAQDGGGQRVRDAARHARDVGHKQREGSDPCFRRGHCWRAGAPIPFAVGRRGIPVDNLGLGDREIERQTLPRVSWNRLESADSLMSANPGQHHRHAPLDVASDLGDERGRVNRHRPRGNGELLFEQPRDVDSQTRQGRNGRPQSLGFAELLGRSVLGGVGGSCIRRWRGVMSLRSASFIVAKSRWNCSMRTRTAK